MKDKDFQQLVDREFAPLTWTDAHHRHILNSIHQEEHPVMKKRIHAALIIAAVFLTMSVTALAAGRYIPSLQDFFDRSNQFSYIFGVPPKSVDASAVVVPVELRNDVDLVELHVSQMYLTDKRLYFTVTAAPKEDNTLLFDGHMTSIALDGKEMRYWHLWDTDYNLYDVGSVQLNDPDANDPYRSVEHVSCYRDPESSAVTNLYAFPYQAEELALFTQPSNTLTFYFHVDNLRSKRGEWRRLVVSFPEMKRIEVPLEILTHE